MMQRNRTFGLLGGMALVCGLVGSSLPAARADLPLSGVNITYHGGTLIQHVKVVPLLYGSSWQGSQGAPYLKGFLQALFADGRYMANLAQFSAGGYQIGNGSALDPILDPAVLAKVSADLSAPGVRYQVSDDQIQAELKAQIAAGKLPQPDPDTLYVICCEHDVVVTFGSADSEFYFSAYHGYDSDVGAAYAVITTTGLDRSKRVETPTGFSDSLFNRSLTADLTHEMAEAVTDSQGDGWLDEKKPDGGEIADLPATLSYYGFISDDQLFDVLTGPDGTKYGVQKVWSNQDKAPVAFGVVPPR